MSYLLFKKSVSINYTLVGFAYETYFYVGYGNKLKYIFLIIVITLMMTDSKETTCVPAKKIKKYLCKDTDCSPIKTDVYTKKCQLCEGFYADDGLNDILFTHLGGRCHLCGNDDGVVRMKNTGEFLCEDACDETDDEY